MASAAEVIDLSG